MATVKRTTIDKLKLDPKNANKHTEYGTGLLENSTRLNGAGRSILISNDDTVIAGNGFTEAAGAIGINKVVVVETDGTEIVAVKRTDIQSGTKEFYNMALADNIVAQKNIAIDAEVVEAIVEEYPEARYWSGVISEDGKPTETLVNHSEAGKTKMTFELTGKQAADVKKALKVAKQRNPNKKSFDNSQALVYVVKEFLKANKEN